MKTWQTGVPSEPGDYVVELPKGQRDIVVHWAEGQRDWRHGAVRIAVVQFFGPLPARPRIARPELRR